jgi:UDP-glucuronate 4-epimerase
MAILVTGGAGFIGSNLVEALLRETSETVIALDNFNDNYDAALKRANIQLVQAHPRLRLVEADLRDEDAAAQTLLEHGVRTIYHLAGSPGVPASLREPRANIENNVLSITNLLESARSYPVERFLFASSSTVYGRGAQTPFVEDAPLGIPTSPYGASKRAAEILGFMYHQVHGVPFTALRLFNVYGPRLRPELSLAAFTRAILDDQPLVLYGDGSIRRDFTHVGDVCRGMLAALTATGIAGQAINLGHDQPVSIRRLIELVEAAAGRPAQIEHRPVRIEDMPFTHADLTKARRLLGYKPQVGLENGVREYVEWFKRSELGKGRE